MLWQRARRRRSTTRSWPPGAGAERVPRHLHPPPLPSTPGRGRPTALAPGGLLGPGQRRGGSVRGGGGGRPMLPAAANPSYTFDAAHWVIHLQADVPPNSLTAWRLGGSLGRGYHLAQGAPGAVPDARPAGGVRGGAGAARGGRRRHQRAPGTARGVLPHACTGSSPPRSTRPSSSSWGQLPVVGGPACPRSPTPPASLPPTAHTGTWCSAGPRPARLRGRRAGGAARNLHLPGPNARCGPERAARWWAGSARPPPTTASTTSAAPRTTARVLQLHVGPSTPAPAGPVAGRRPRGPAASWLLPDDVATAVVYHHLTG